MSDPAPPPLAVTMGEPAGIGGEILLKAWRRRGEDLPPFFAVDDPARLAGLARRLGWTVPLAVIADPAEAGAAGRAALPVMASPLAAPATPGVLDPANARSVVASIETAVRLTLNGTAAAVVTNPIHKRTLYAAGFAYPGHTEFLAALSDPAAQPVMMLEGGGLRVVPVMVHASLRDSIAGLTTAAIVAKGRIAARALTDDFAVARPRLAVAGLNPHAGEAGTLGREEIEIIEPAVAELRREGIDARGPISPDTMFHAGARATYDAALCMYHDQALIPLKTLDFERGVNITLGLPFVRTSPDHGTALDIAGTGRASEESLVAALRRAAAIAGHRARAAARVPA